MIRFQLLFKRESQVFKNVSFEPNSVAVSLSLLKREKKLHLKLNFYINFIISIIMKSLPTAVEKMPEKHPKSAVWVEFFTVHHHGIEKNLPLYGFETKFERDLK